MADWSSRTVTTTVKEYTLPSPTNWAEIGKVYAAIEQELPEERRHADDTVTIEARDDEIVFSYRMESRSEPA